MSNYRLEPTSRKREDQFESRRLGKRFIRLHWAYLLGLLEGAAATGNHPGCLIFDEPSSIRGRERLPGMLPHALGEKNCQIIITTSHERESIGA